MIVALVDNGSLEPAAHRALRALAAALTERTSTPVLAVSWKHSDRIDPALLGGTPALTLRPWLAAALQRRERDFVFIPFFISAQGAIGSWLRRDIEALRREATPFNFTFTAGLSSPATLVRIVVDRIRVTVRETGATKPNVIVVDHGGPAAASAALRNEVADGVRSVLGSDIGELAAASLEGARHDHNLPLFADALATAPFDQGDVIVAPLFLAPGRHAGPDGDLTQIARASQERCTANALRCHFTPLVGTHPHVADVLASALAGTLSTFHAAA